MREKIVGCIALAVAAVLFLIAALFVIGRDNEGPEIMIPSGMSYTDGQDLSVLLNGVTARDAKDGDVSGSLVVESLIVLDGGDRAKVTYIAKDNSNNVTRTNTIVNYSGSGNNIYSTFSKAEEGSSQDAEPTQPVTELETKETETESSTVKVTDEDGTTDTQERESISKENPTKETTTKDKPVKENNTTKESTDSSSPVIKLSASETTIKKGESFKVFKFVKDITDDKDNRDYLFERISISGKYDVNTPGNYELYIYCVDSDKHESNKEKFVLHVTGDTTTQQPTTKQPETTTQAQTQQPTTTQPETTTQAQTQQPTTTQPETTTQAQTQQPTTTQPETTTQAQTQQPTTTQPETTTQAQTQQPTTTQPETTTQAQPETTTEQGKAQQESTT